MSAGNVTQTNYDKIVTIFVTVRIGESGAIGSAGCRALVPLDWPRAWG
jgi:hypothetical protein